MSRRPLRWWIGAGVAAAIAALALAAAAQPPAAPRTPRLGPPRLAVDGSLRWGVAEVAAPAELASLRKALAGTADSARLAAWRALAGHPRWRLYALRRAAALALAPWSRARAACGSGRR